MKELHRGRLSSLESTVLTDLASVSDAGQPLKAYAVRGQEPCSLFIIT